MTITLPLVETSAARACDGAVHDTRGSLAGTGPALHSPVPAIEISLSGAVAAFSSDGVVPHH